MEEETPQSKRLRLNFTNPLESLGIKLPPDMPLIISSIEDYREMELFTFHHISSQLACIACDALSSYYFAKMDTKKSHSGHVHCLYRCSKCHQLAPLLRILTRDVECDGLWDHASYLRQLFVGLPDASMPTKKVDVAVETDPLSVLDDDESEANEYTATEASFEQDESSTEEASVFSCTSQASDRSGAPKHIPRSVHKSVLQSKSGWIADELIALSQLFSLMIPHMPQKTGRELHMTASTIFGHYHIVCPEFKEDLEIEGPLIRTMRASQKQTEGISSDGEDKEQVALPEWSDDQSSFERIRLQIEPADTFKVLGLPNRIALLQDLIKKAGIEKFLYDYQFLGKTMLEMYFVKGKMPPNSKIFDDQKLKWNFRTVLTDEVLLLDDVKDSHYVMAEHIVSLCKRQRARGMFRAIIKGYSRNVVLKALEKLKTVDRRNYQPMMSSP